MPTFAASLFGWLIGYRLLAWWQDAQRAVDAEPVRAQPSRSRSLTFIGEAIGIGIAFHVSPLRVLSVAFDFDAGIRPGWQVLAAGLAVVALDFVRARWNSRHGAHARGRGGIGDGDGDVCGLRMAPGRRGWGWKKMRPNDVARAATNLSRRPIPASASAPISRIPISISTPTSPICSACSNSRT